MPAVINVTTLADGTGPGTLRSAIAQANTNDANGDTNNTINLTVAGTYNIGQLGSLAIFTNATTGQSGLKLDIENTSGGNVAISGNNLTRVFDINPNDINGGATPNGLILGAVTIGGVTIENGLAQPGDNQVGSGGGIRDQGPVDLVLNNDVLTDNSASADGGGVSMEQPGSVASTKWMLILNNTTVTNNHAGDAGGGVESDGTGIVNITNSIIADNSCLNQGAGVWADNIGTGSATVTVTGTVVSGNSAGMLGGGIGNAGNSTVTISSSTIAHNFTTGDGGGFANQAAVGTPLAGTLIVQNSVFLANAAGLNGGGIEEGGTASITNSEIKDNAAGVNGGVAVGALTGGSGGGLFIDGGTLALTASTLAGNTATINGGGIELRTTGASNITNTTITGNTALNNAGGNNGGGIDDAATGTLALVDDTINGNFAANGGGIFFAGTTGLTIQNTLLAGNVASTLGPDADFTGTPTGVDLGGNLVGIAGANSGNAAFTSGTTQTGSVATPLLAQLAGLANNGGPVAGAMGNQITLETEAELIGSPAVGKGLTNGVTTDERGFNRTGASDIGAFQFQNNTLTLTVAPQTPTVNVNGTVVFTVTVTNTGANMLPPDNASVQVTVGAGLTTGGPLTFTVGALSAGASAMFNVTTTATTLGTQTVTASLTSPDTNPATATASGTVNVTNAPPPGPPPGPPAPSLISAIFGLYIAQVEVDLGFNTTAAQANIDFFSKYTIFGGMNIAGLIENLANTNVAKARSGGNT